MGLSRRFLNMIVLNRRIRGARSLVRIDLTRLFNPSTASSTIAASASKQEEGGSPTLAMQMKRIRFPRPIFRFQACTAEGPYYPWQIECFPVGDSKVLCTDQGGRAFLFDAYTRHLLPMPTLHKPKLMPASLFVPSTDGGGGSLFLMEHVPGPEPRTSRGQPSDQFEAFVYDKTSMSWQCHLLPPPPYVHDASYFDGGNRIISAAVVGAHICISVVGVGTYCMDTTSHTWTQAGNWELPFRGNAYYVPELNLWFGLSTNQRRHLAAADLSNMDSQPQLLGTWNELETPEEWEECRYAELGNLGAGRFCIARFFQTSTIDDFGNELNNYFTVLTGVEVVPRRVHNGGADANSSGTGSCGNDNMQLQMILHKSVCHKPDNTTTIQALF